MHAPTITARRLQRGFTLLEMVVVILIIGILVSFAGLSVGNRALSDTLQSETQRLQAVLGLAGETAEGNGIQFGLLFHRDGYRVLVLGNEGLWKDYEASGPLKKHVFSAPIDLGLVVEGSRVALAPADELALEELTANERRGSKEQKPIVPQILLLSSGELTPFTLDLSAVGLVEQQRITGDLLGRISVERSAKSGS